ncbi:head maturation protease, ClpP-related [Pedobacter sp. SYSU D00535]|uniref:head maturation protease, ClpP-related n=1 Tax=Pedobacter sp. SYSU D00535 TaxID=2810308 RepID=UPI001A96FB50|nr:head maturation protease, ClpP-related [Pedobacter sp. SYSU D00535]
MAEILLHDYEEESWFGKISYGIGQGNLSSNVIVPLIHEAKGEELTVRLSSGGGSVFHGFRIYNALVEHGNVHIIIEGIAASIASVIAMAGSKITAKAGSMLMVHKPTTQVWMYDSMNADELQSEADALNKVQEVLNSLYTKRTGLEPEVIDALINKTTWLTPADALALNFVTDIEEGKTASASIPDKVMNYIFHSAPQRVKDYANQYYPKTTDMNKETKEALKQNKGLLSGLKNAFNNFFNSIEEIENSEATTKDGTTFFYEGELAEGTPVFADAEMTTALADGDYELEDGRSMTVASGAVSTIAEAASENSEDKEDSEEITELQNRIAELEAENQELKAENQEVTTALNDTNKVLNVIKQKKSTHEPKDRKQNFKKDAKTKEDEEDFRNKLEETRNRIKNKGKDKKD